MQAKTHHIQGLRVANRNLLSALWVRAGLGGLELKAPADLGSARPGIAINFRTMWITYAV